MGCDLVHAVGNIFLTLYDDGVDFAVWCNYKYFNAGFGVVGGCFVYECHANSDLLRIAGWWGYEQQTRFRMDL